MVTYFSDERIKDNVKVNKGPNQRYSFEHLKEIDVELLRIKYQSSRYHLLKRVLDLSIGALMVIPAGVVVLVSGIIIKLDSKGPIFYIDPRIGMNGKELKIYKLRTMIENAADLGPAYTKENDSRITRVGKILRRFRIDELPQLINVFKNEISLVGPRPLHRVEYENSPEKFRFRLIARPGMTGLAQIRGGNELSNEEKLMYDLEYISEFSLKRDLMIILNTFRILLSGEGSR